MLDTAGISIDGTHHAACTHVGVQLYEPGRGVEVVRVEGAVLHVARTAIFTEARFVDADDPRRILGTGTVDWSIIGRTPPGFVYADPGPGVPDSPDLPPLPLAYDVRPAAGGYVIEGLSARLGTDVLHHGPMLVASEAAALDAVHAEGRSVAGIESCGLRLVRAGRAGPFVTAATVVVERHDLTVCRTEMVDRGQHDALIAVGLVRVRTG
jgi:acyl-coenzyme A thioesterase PaaI-like protein